MPRKDSRTPAQQQAARRFEIVRATYDNPNETPYDTLIAEQERKTHRITTPEGYLAMLKEKRDEHLAARDKAALDKEYRAAMFQHPVVQKLLRLQAYYAADESIDQALVDRVGEVIQQWTEPHASRVVAEKWANELFETENKRRDSVEQQLNAESAKWNERMAALRNARTALEELPDSSVAATDKPATLEGNVNFKSDTLVGKSFELWGLVDNDVRDVIDAAQLLHKHGRPEKLEAIVSKYEKRPAATESDQIQRAAEKVIAADAEQGGFDA